MPCRISFHKCNSGAFHGDVGPGAHRDADVRSRQSRGIIYSVSEDQTLRVWELESGNCLWVLHGNSKLVNAVVISADGRVAVSASANQMVQVWDLRTGLCQASFTGESLIGAGQ